MEVDIREDDYLKLKVEWEFIKRMEEEHGVGTENVLVAQPALKIVPSFNVANIRDFVPARNNSMGLEGTMENDLKVMAYVVDAETEGDGEGESPCSEHFGCKFTIDHRQYSSVVQWKMHKKTKLFSHGGLVESIMLMTDTEAMKMAGRNIPDFDQSVWDECSNDIRYIGNIPKFLQGLDLHLALKATVGSDQNRETGNLLGEILTDVRDELISYGRPSTRACLECSERTWWFDTFGNKL